MLALIKRVHTAPCIKFNHSSKVTKQSKMMYHIMFQLHDAFLITATHPFHFIKSLKFNEIILYTKF